MAGFDVPSWLQPMSEGERKRLDLAEEEVKQKGVVMLRKQIGLAKMKSDAERLKAQGMDEGTARKNALLDNADLIFADSPQAFASILNSEEAADIRRRGQDLLDAQKAATLQERTAHNQSLVELSGVRNENALLRGQETFRHNLATEGRDVRRLDQFDRGLDIKADTASRAEDRRDRALDETITHNFENEEAARAANERLWAAIDETSAHNVETERQGRDKIAKGPAAGAAPKISQADAIRLRALYAERKDINKAIAAKENLGPSEEMVAMKRSRNRLEKEINTFEQELRASAAPKVQDLPGAAGNETPGAPLTIGSPAPNPAYLDRMSRQDAPVSPPPNPAYLERMSRQDTPMLPQTNAAAKEWSGGVGRLPKDTNEATKKKFRYDPVTRKLYEVK